MTRTLSKLAFCASLTILAIPSGAFAGRGGGMRGGGGGMQRGGGGGSGGGMQRGGGGSGGGMSHSPAFSQPRSQTGGSANSGRNPNANMAGTGNRNSGSGYPNAANRNQTGNRSNAGSAAAGADAANRNQTGNRSNAGSAAAGADYANRNQTGNRSNAGSAAAGADYANRNQTGNRSNAGSAAAGADYANRNQTGNYPNAGAAAAGAGFANHNQYNQYHPGLANGTWNGNNAGLRGARAGTGLAGYGLGGWGMGAAGYGLGYANGVGAWGTGSPMYAWGYSNYNNPYYGGGDGSAGGSQAVAATQAGSNYSQPIDTTAPPPESTVTDQATAAFDQARDAFKAGDYDTALTLTKQALTQMPNDTTMHEFLALVLFAQGKYDQAAAPLYSVLSVGPGWDWTTLSGMYADVEIYTKQLRALESYLGKNRNSANARFVLFYHYMTEGHEQDAVAQLKQVVKLQPNDKLSAQLLAQFQPAGSPAPPPAESAPPAESGKEGKLPGTWLAAPAKDAKISLAIKGDGGFTWTVSAPASRRPPSRASSTYADGVLTLAGKEGQNGALVGRLAWQDDNHFTFRLVGGPSGDTGLKFGR